MLVALLVMGTYLLIADLSREERRGTLNFIRMSPESAKNILLGKLLGVPILVYFTVEFGTTIALSIRISSKNPTNLNFGFLRGPGDGMSVLLPIVSGHWYSGRGLGRTYPVGWQLGAVWWFTIHDDGDRPRRI